MNNASIVLFVLAFLVGFQFKTSNKVQPHWDKDNVMTALLMLGLCTLASTLYALQMGWL